MDKCPNKDGGELREYLLVKRFYEDNYFVLIDNYKVSICTVCEGHFTDVDQTRHNTLMKNRGDKQYKHFHTTLKPPRSRHPIGKLPHAYKWGNNPACEESEYNCSECGLQVFGEDVRFVAYGRTCANGEHSPCPYCGRENYVHRAVEEDA